jgi:threonine dehydrogenase-like Zn-dependent dehydrogenase
MESAALLEPLSVAIHATRRATIEQGDTAIVFGAGTVGLLTAAMAKVSGATTVVIADIDYGRINYALANGFAHKGYIVTSRKDTPNTAKNFDQARELADDIMQIASLNDPEFEGADVTFDCTGKEICMQAGLYVSLVMPQKVIIAHSETGNKTRRTARHGWNGHSNPNTSHVGFPLERSRHHWHISLCKHVPHGHQTHLRRRITKS